MNKLKLFKCPQHETKKAITVKLAHRLILESQKVDDGTKESFLAMAEQNAAKIFKYI
jgi:hypothetical protein